MAQKMLRQIAARHEDPQRRVGLPHTTCFIARVNVAAMTFVSVFLRSIVVTAFAVLTTSPAASAASNPLGGCQPRFNVNRHTQCGCACLPHLAPHRAENVVGPQRCIELVVAPC